MVMGSKREKFENLWAAGFDYEEIARVLEVAERTLYKWRIELGLPRRRPGRKPL